MVPGSPLQRSLACQAHPGGAWLVRSLADDAPGREAPGLKSRKSATWKWIWGKRDFPCKSNYTSIVFVFLFFLVGGADEERESNGVSGTRLFRAFKYNWDISRCCGPVQVTTPQHCSCGDPAFATPKPLCGPISKKVKRRSTNKFEMGKSGYTCSQ